MFEPAKRSKAHLKLGLMGASGSGKTYSALLLARGLAGPKGKIAGVDTENGSMSLYSSVTNFDVLTMAPPFDPKNAIEAIHFAEKNGYDCLVIDSFSHFWKWILDFKEGLDHSNPRGGFTNWGKAKPLFEELKVAILNANMHVICCMRSKQEYVIEKNAQGKDVPKKVGMGAILEPDIEYEFTSVFTIGDDHQAFGTKDRTGIFDQKFHKISEKTGTDLMTWLGGKAEAKEPPIAKKAETKVADATTVAVLNFGNRPPVPPEVFGVVFKAWPKDEMYTQSPSAETRKKIGEILDSREVAVDDRFRLRKLVSGMFSMEFDSSNAEIAMFYQWIKTVSDDELDIALDCANKVAELETTSPPDAETKANEDEYDPYTDN